ncbi:hypothetical protein U9M48_011793 [Paspalum notatum var. saurae]|uniref:ubiquitinyl hydrolase 1 n=1 Tax=Paspalum notatum var. saurae TaxID=547442 RepID=A0AAQ3WI21_PASNO
MLNMPYSQQQVQNFGEPFFRVIREDETLSSIKERIQKKLKGPNDDFSKWKFACISLGRPDYFEDSDTVAIKFQRNMYGAWEQYLGLQHPDTTFRNLTMVYPFFVSKYSIKLWCRYAFEYVT